MVITADEGVRAGKTIPLKEIVDEAVEGCECVKKVFVSRRTGSDVAMTADRDVQLEQVAHSLTHTHTHTQLNYNLLPAQAMSEVSEICAPEPLDSEDPLFMLYTSGSTGTPKGILHTQAGYLLYTSVTQQVSMCVCADTD